MQTFKKMAFDTNKLEQMQIVEDSKCCLKVNAVITKAGVYQYDDGLAYKPATELLKAVRTAQYAKLTLHDHPSTKVIMSQNDLYGGVEKPYWDRDKMRAVLNFDKAMTTPELLDKIRQAVIKKTGLDNSIGFYYIPDWTPGTAPNVNTGQSSRYDYVMRDIVIDHVAVMFDGKVRGRCTFPNCGIGVDSIMRNIEIGLDKVVKRGEKWCVVHCHGEEEGEAIKCFEGPDAEEKAKAMHKAIQAQKHASSAGTVRDIATFVSLKKLDDSQWQQLFGMDNNRPPKDWFESCVTKASAFADNPEAFCGWLYNHGPDELRQGFGASVSTQTGGGKTNLSKTKTDYVNTMTPEDEEKAFNECVAQRMAEGMERGEAEAHCRAATKPSDQPTPPLDLDAKKKADQDPDPHQEGEEKTPLERCIASQMEQGKSAEEAEAWCKDEMSGKHEETDAVIKRSTEFLRMKEQRDIERARANRRNPT